MLKRTGIAAVIIAAIGLSGCGGGGTSGGTGSSDSFLFLTDAVNTSYDHVWTTVNKVDLVDSTGKLTTIFDSSASGGVTVDLPSLHPASGQQYMLLTGFSMPAGSYVGANVTVASALSMVPKGATSAESASFATATGGSTVLQTKFAGPISAGSSSNLVLDFNLANWNVSGGKVTATNDDFVQSDPHHGTIDSGSTSRGHYEGIVTGMGGTAPNYTFALGRGSCLVNVATSATTVVSNLDGSDNPILTNDARVEVSGTFDTTSKTLNASTITIDVGGSVPPASRTSGLVSATDLARNTITIQLQDCKGFQPQATSLTIVVTSTTAFVESNGVTDTEAQFFAALTAGKSVIEAKGSLSGKVFTATAIGIVPDHSEGNSGSGGGSSTDPKTVSVMGPTSTIDSVSGTFSLTLSRWTGGWQRPDAVFKVITTSKTTYSNKDAVLDFAAFFAALSTGTSVRVRGTLDRTTMTVTAEAIAIERPKSGN